MLITGGSKGLGFATALEFARNGATVTITGRGQDALDGACEAASAEGITLEAIQGDVSVEADCRRAVDAVLAAHGRVDVLSTPPGCSSRGTPGRRRPTSGT